MTVRSLGRIGLSIVAFLALSGCASEKKSGPDTAKSGPPDAAGTVAHDDADRAAAELEAQKKPADPPPRRDPQRGRGTVDQPRTGRP